MLVGTKEQHVARRRIDERAENQLCAVMDDDNISAATVGVGPRLRRLWKGCPEGCPTPGPHPVWLCDQCKNHLSYEYEQALSINEARDSSWLTT